MQQIRHRSDIDGLRALAVLPVVAYHVGIGAAPGGFVGVDVFFVISGYLITLVLLKDIANHQFSLVRFYERRVRRIVPALVPILIVTYVVCARYSLPSEFLAYSKSLIAATLSASNFYFWSTTSYFSAPAGTEPLLHTWSLAVEEQFYIFWPLCLWLAFRFLRNRVLLATSLVAALSFALSAVGAFTHPTATFYLVPTRAWELLLGAMLALGLFPSPANARVREVLSLMGFLLICSSVFLIRSYMPFPGLLAAPACIGALLIILAGRDGPSLVGRLLSWRPIAFIGLISYSVYLWHWPLVVFQRDYGIFLIPGAPGRDQKLLVIACSLILGALSWKFVEQPFRVGRRRPARALLFQVATAAATVFVAVGAVTWAAGGFPGRYSRHQLRLAAYLNYDRAGSAKKDACFLDTGHESFPAHCLKLSRTKPNVLLLGDSHAAELWYGLRSEYPHIHFLQATASDCFPVLDHGWQEAPSCVHAINRVLQGYLATHHVSMVVIAARWKASYLHRIAQTLSWLHSRSIPVTLVGPTLIFDMPLPRLMMTAARTDDARLINQSWNHALWGLDHKMSRIARAHHAAYISMLRLFCSPQACDTTDAEGMPLIFDDEHLTTQGSLFVARRLKALGVWRALGSQGPSPAEHTLQVSLHAQAPFHRP